MPDRPHSQTTTSSLAPSAGRARGGGPSALADQLIRGSKRFHCRTLPQQRLVGFAGATLLLLLWTSLQGEPLAAALPWAIGIAAAYWTLSTLALRFLFERFGSRLSSFFLILDVPIFFAMLATAGAVDTPLALLALARIADQGQSFLRSFLFTCVVAVSLPAVGGLVQTLWGGETSWSSIAVLATVLVLVGSYLATLARSEESRRLRTDQAVLAAQSLVSQLEDQNHELEDRTRELQDARLRAEAASRSKGHFLANMSHEIRTPMNGVLGMTELALERAVDEEQATNLRIVRSSAESLLSLLNDILDLSKIEAGKLDLEPIEFGVRDTLRDTIAMLRVRARQKGIECFETVAEGTPERLVGDPGRLRQLLVNLVGNAIKFTEEGKVEVEVWRESRSERRCLLHFVVRDTGIGIAPEKIKTIFEAFTQADSRTTRRFGGTGLGLAISQQLVELMGGKIWARSEVGVGSEFHFTLPLGVAKPSKAPAPMSRLNLQVQRVLVVEGDDDPQLMTQLNSSGFVVTSTSSAREAVQTFQEQRTEQPFQMIVIDARSHQIDGFEVAELLRAELDLDEQQPPIALLAAGKGERGDASRCRRLGIDVYLTQPIAPLELIRALRMMFSSRAHGRKPSLITRHRLRELGPPPRVLLAEDNRVNQRLAIRLLEKVGVEVEVAENGADAVEKFLKSSFDAVLMDVQMPEMDGIEATTRIRQAEAPSGARTPIVALTAHAMKGDRERCLEAGMDAYVTKPIRSDRLYAVLEAQLPALGALPPAPTEPTSESALADLRVPVST